jgi:biotin-dependent carboxylase-like uncharacterized protein
MSFALTIIDPGIATSVQDQGRFGLRRFGVPQAGALDPLLLRAVNHLLGNPPGSAGLEILVVGPTLAAGERPIALALGGEISGEIFCSDGSRQNVTAWHGFVLRPGERIRIGAVRRGTAYLAVSGGLQTEFSLGSRSTYRRAGLGTALTESGLLPCGQAQDHFTAPPWQNETGAIRLLRGPQHRHFTDEAAAILVSHPYRVASNSDRMGLRLKGPILNHTSLGAECATEAVLPGLIQVPADGQPILLLADSQTTGGYAKIAAVISADLPRLGHLRAGDSLDFRWVEREEALAALTRERDRFALWRQRIGRAFAPIDAAALYGNNLISGMTAGGDE